jgi:hypothetical protein
MCNIFISKLTQGSENNNLFIQKLPAMSGVAMCTIFILKI